MGILKVDRKELEEPLAKLESRIKERGFETRDGVGLFMPVIVKLDNRRFERSRIHDAIEECRDGGDCTHLREQLAKVNLTRRNVTWLYIGLPCAVVGIALLAYSLHVWMQSERSGSWPSTRGIVIETEITHHRGKNQGSSSVSTIYDGHIRYEYGVDGTTYTSGRFAFAGPPERSSSDREKVETFIAGYPQGSEVDVYYDPSDPRSAVLIPGTNPGNKWLPILGLVVTLGGLVGVGGAVFSFIRYR